MFVCMGACVGVFVCMYALRIVSMDKILCFINNVIIILVYQSCTFGKVTEIISGDDVEQKRPMIGCISLSSYIYNLSSLSGRFSRTSSKMALLSKRKEFGRYAATPKNSERSRQRSAKMKLIPWRTSIL